jgi:uncharacterized protein YprB with RNaseH-like and TPR domain
MSNPQYGGRVDVQDRVAGILRRRHGSEPISAPERHPGPALDVLVPGYWLYSGDERLFVGERCFPLEHRHGHWDLVDGCRAAEASWPRVLFTGHRPFDLGKALFLDTETTGLGRGPGTFCFMVGTARVEQDHLVVRQYMAPDYGDEPLLLRVIADVAAEASGLATFNGRTFDLPVLETRYVLNGYVRSPLHGLGHLDLLFVARRLWGRSLPSCALGSLERSLLGVERGEADIPGYEIPGIYANYLATGATEDVARVFHHNLYDVLSMVSLTAQAAMALAGVDGLEPCVACDPVAVGRLREADDAPELAAAAYRAGMAAVQGHTRSEARRRLALMHKRAGRLGEATGLWLDALDEGALYPYTELAKYYEHTLRDYAQAELLVRRAMQGLAVGTIAHPSPAGELDQLARRLERLRRHQHRAVVSMGFGATAE